MPTKPESQKKRSGNKRYEETHLALKSSKVSSCSALRRTVVVKLAELTMRPGTTTRAARGWRRLARARVETPRVTRRRAKEDIVVFFERGEGIQLPGVEEVFERGKRNSTGVSGFEEGSLRK